MILSNFPCGSDTAALLELRAQIATLLNELTANPEYAPTAEVVDIRTGHDGTVYDTAGEAVRALGSGLANIESIIRIIQENIGKKVDGAYVEEGYLYLTSGENLCAGPLGPFSGTGGLAFSDWYYDTETFYLHLYDENGDDVIEPVYIPGGGGGGSSGASVPKLENIDGTVASFAIAMGSDAFISFSFYDFDSGGEPTNSGGVLELYVNNVGVSSRHIEQGKHKINWKEYLEEGTNKLKIKVTNDDGIYATKSYTVTVLNVGLTATLDDNISYEAGKSFLIDYTPIGPGLEKTTHFIVDGEEVATAVTAYSGRLSHQSITINEHGAHDIDVFCTAQADSTEVKSETVHFRIAVIDKDATDPIVIVPQKEITCQAYSNVSVRYMVYDPQTETASITRAIDGEETVLTVGRTMQTWNVKLSKVGDHTLAITCRGTSDIITLHVTALDYEINPVTNGLLFDFDPSGRSNSAANRDEWYSQGVKLSVSDNFDWSNGGFRTDTDGSAAFVIKAGCRATVECNLFPDITDRYLKTNGANFKMIFAAKNTRSFDATVATCMSGNIGLSINAKEAVLSARNTSIKQYIAEGERIEFEYNITGQNNNSEMFLILNGVPAKFAVYDESSSLNQTAPVPLVIGSDECDVWVYRCKSYSMSLTDADIMDNYVADAPDPETMIARFEQNTVAVTTGNTTTRMFIDWNADAVDEKVIDTFAKEHPGLRVIKLRCPRFTTDKDDKVSGSSVQHILYGARNCDRWLNGTVTHRGQGTSSNAYGKAARNLDIDCKGQFVYTDENGDEVPMDKYAMTDNSIGETYFNIKLNVASSENMNNAMLARLFNKYQPYLRDVRENNPKVRDTMEFYPCVVFVYNESDEEGFTQNQWIFYGVGDFGNSKKDKKAQGLDSSVHPNECIVELCNNTHVYNRFKSYDGIMDDVSWESDDNPNAPLSFRYIADTCDETAARKAWRDATEWVNSTDRTAATNELLPSPITYAGVSYSRDTAEYRAAKFIAEFEDHFEPKSTIYHYLFTSYFIMADNRAKNTFPHCPDVTAEKPIWDYVFGYDFDTSMGINNEGDLDLDYGMEDTDQIGSKDVFNAQDSVLWINVRDLLTGQISNILSGLTELFNTKMLNREFDAYQNMRPVSMRVADARRKYIRPYEELTETDSNGNVKRITMFIPMMNGDKMPQRHYFLKYQDVYFASRFNTPTAKNDKITLRGFPNPNGDIAAITITPYSDLYVTILFGSILKQQRCKRGETVTLSMSEDTALNDTEIYIYSASMLEGLEGLPSVMTNQADFTSASKLRIIRVGDDSDDYSNPNLVSTVKWDLSGLSNLEEFYIDHCPNFTASVDVSGCTALRVFSAKKTPVASVLFAPGGSLEECYLEAPSSIILREMQNISVFDIADYSNVVGIRHENTLFPAALDLINSAENLAAVRITGAKWEITDVSILSRLLELHGYNENGDEIAQSVLAGTVKVSVIRQQLYDQCRNMWRDLTIIYENLIPQYRLSFFNEDGTPLKRKDTLADYVQYVDRGENGYDPVAAGEIDTPTKESSVSQDFHYAGWDDDLTIVLTDRNVFAIYNATTRKYTVTWKTGIKDVTKVVDYGSEAVYDDDFPVKTDMESAYSYSLFQGWDKSTGNIKGDTVVNAIWDRVDLPAAGTELSDMNLTQLYAIRQSGKAAEYVSKKDRFAYRLGYEPIFDDVESVVLAENVSLDGQTRIDTGIKLFSEDRDWTMVIDGVYEQPTEGACLMSCFTEDGFHGFKAKYRGGFAIQWSSNSVTDGVATSVSTVGDTPVLTGYQRDLAVLRHRKGNPNLTVYLSKPGSSSVVVTELTKTITTVSDATIVIGCDNDGANYCFGELYKAKLWYDDLGDAECRKMAVWPGEEAALEVIGTAGANLSAGGKTIVDFINASLFCAGHRMNPTNSNEGAWPETEMREWVSSRCFAALPVQLQRMIQEVNINAIEYVDGTNANIVQCTDKLYLPSYYDMQNTNNEPYIYSGKWIEWFTNNASRIKFIGYIIPEDATVTSADTPPTNPKIGDVWIATSNGSYGYIWNGRIWVYARWNWLRDASVAYSSGFGGVSNGGNVNGYYYYYYAAAVGGVDLRLSI